MTGLTGDLPPVEGLSERQLSGSACVWCAAPLGCASGVDLGTRPYPDMPYAAWFPRRCADGCLLVAGQAPAPGGPS